MKEKNSYFNFRIRKTIRFFQFVDEAISSCFQKSKNFKNYGMTEKNTISFLDFRKRFVFRFF